MMSAFDVPSPNPMGKVCKQPTTGVDDVKEKTPMYDIPKNKNYPTGPLFEVGQCDDCGGHGCATCEQNGWLPIDHPKVRRCASERCGKVLSPEWVPVYCSNECALDDA